MARSSGVWPRKTKGGVVYYTKIDGKQIRLSDNEEEAKEKFARLTRSALPGNTSPARDVCDEFLEHVQKNRTAKTYRTYSHFLNSFCRLYGGVLVAELTRRHATRWVESEKGWNPSTRASAGSILKVCYRWAVDEGLIPINPFTSLKKSGELKRERVLTAQEWERFLATAREPFRTFLLAVRLSGCRPGEVRAVTAAMVDLEAGCWIIPLHKTRGKTKEPRIVWLSPELLVLTKQQLGQGSGFLFRNTVGRQWSEGSVVNAFARLRKRLGMGPEVVCYSLRHTYATEALEKIDVATVAELLGHKGVNTLMRNYAHLRKRGGHMRAAAAKVVTECAEGGVSGVPPVNNPGSDPR